MRAADHLVDMGPGAGEHGGHVVAEGTAAEVEKVRESLTGQYLAGTRVIETPAKRRKPSGYIGIEGAAENNLKKVDVKVPLGVLTTVTGVSGSGKSTLVNEVLYKSLANRLHRTQAASRGAPPDHRDRPAGQDHLGRSVADRAHAAIESGDVHRAVRSDPRAVLQDPGGAGPGLQARPVLVQRQGWPLRGVPRRRADQDRDALPARRLRALRAVPRQAVQPGDARGPLQGQDDRRRARDADRGGARVLRAHSEDPPARPGARRRRARVHAARPAGDDALGRRGPAGQARRRAFARSRPAGRSTSWTSRRPACTSRTSSGCSRCSSDSSTPATRSS